MSARLPLSCYAISHSSSIKVGYPNEHVIGSALVRFWHEADPLTSPARDMRNLCHKRRHTGRQYRPEAGPRMWEALAFVSTSA
jgi:hypothetical protein